MPQNLYEEFCLVKLQKNMRVRVWLTFVQKRVLLPDVATAADESSVNDTLVVVEINLEVCLARQFLNYFAKRILLPRW